MTAVAVARAPLRAGDRLGRYLLVGPLGAGAMGEVWTADDPELGRKVAIKVLKDELTIWSERLRREARAMAQLVDPGVVAVYDVGEAGGRVYVAMELIDGTNLREWLATARPWRAIVELFVAAGRGLAAAHAAGLVHRDFKPDNVLVARDGRVAVGDFGIARLGVDEPDRDAGLAPSSRGETVSGEAATVPGGSDPGLPSPAAPPGTPPASDRARLLATLTDAGDLIGTPAYMAPEQHQGHPASIASDQFAFSVSLWEALYGRRPFSASPEDGLPPSASVGLAIVSGRLHPPPAGARVPGWLRRAVARGLDGDPTRRHPSIQALITTLASGLARRRRALIGGTAAVAVVATAVVAVTVFGGGAARPSCKLAAAHVGTVWNPAARASLAATFGASDRPHAPTTLARVTEEIDRRATTLGAARVSACEATHVRGEQSPAALDRHMACLDRRVVELGAMVTLLGNTPDPELVDAAYEAVTALASPDDCPMAAHSDTPQPPADVAERVAATRIALAAAEALLFTGKIDDASRAIEPLAATARQLAYPPLLAEVLGVRGHIVAEKGEAAAGEVAFQEAAVAAAAAADDALVAAAMIAQIELLTDEGGNAAGALERLGPAEVAVTRGGRAALREGFLVARGNVYIGLARYEEARADLEAARRTGQARDGATDLEIGRITARLATALWHLGHNAEALALDRETLALWEASLGPDHPKVGQLLNNMGIRLESAGEYEEARRQLERSLSIKERSLGSGHPSVAFTLNNLGMVAEDQGRTDDQAAFNVRALAIREQALGADHPLVASSLSNLAIARHRQHRLDDALALLGRALAIREKALGTDHPSVAHTLSTQALVLADLERHPEALASAQRALAIREKALGAEHELVAWSHSTLGSVLKHLRRDREACAAFARAVAILERVHGPDHADLGAFLGDHASCLLASGRARDALTAAERAVAISAATGKDSMLSAGARFALARALWDTGGDRRRAVEQARAARDIFDSDPGASPASAAPVKAWIRTHVVR